MRNFALLVACLALLASESAAQTVRFDTNVGSFNVVLNPTDNPDLQDHVDNFLGYVGLGRYHFSVIHRDADLQNGDDFVLQMGGFSAFPGNSDAFAQLFPAIEAGPPVIVDFSTTGLSNTTGTISLALQQGQPNSGTSSFFVNLRDNIASDNPTDPDLDAQTFVPFAEIQSIASLDPIIELDKVNLNAQANSGAFSDVPVINENQFVIVQDVVVVDADEDFSFVGPIQQLLGIENLEPPTSASSVSAVSTANNGGGVSVSSIPEPGCFLLALISGASLATQRRRR